MPKPKWPEEVPPKNRNDTPRRGNFICLLFLVLLKKILAKICSFNCLIKYFNFTDKKILVTLIKSPPPKKKELLMYLQTDFIYKRVEMFKNLLFLFLSPSRKDGGKDNTPSPGCPIISIPRIPRLSEKKKLTQ